MLLSRWIAIFQCVWFDVVKENWRTKTPCDCVRQCIFLLESKCAPLSRHLVTMKAFLYALFEPLKLSPTYSNPSKAVLLLQRTAILGTQVPLIEGVLSYLLSVDCIYIYIRNVHCALRQRPVSRGERQCEGSAVNTQPRPAQLPSPLESSLHLIPPTRTRS